MSAKFFMKDPLEKTEFAPKRFRAFVDLIRPFTLMAPFFGALSGSFLGLIANNDLGGITVGSSFPFIVWEGLPLTDMLSGIISLVFLNAASNTLNQVYDREIDSINKPYRPITTGVVTPKEGIWIAFLLYGFSLWRAALINRWFFALVVILITFTVLYSIPPVRFKKRLWLANLSIAIPRGILGFVAAWTITGDVSDPTPWLIGSIMGLFLIGSTTAKDFTDMEGDKRFGMRTLPVVYGKRKAIHMSIPFLLAPFIIMGLYWYLDYLPAYTIFLSMIMLVWSLLVTYLFLKDADREDEHFENSPVWMQFYLILMAMQVGFLLVFIFD